MKQIIYTIGILMFLSGPFHPWVGQAADEKPASYYDCGFTSDPACWVNTRVGSALNKVEYALQGTDGLDWGDNFGSTDPEEVGQNLYLTIYSKTQSNTLGDAIHATAEQYGMPPERMSLILGGDITPILERSPTMRIEDAVRIYNQMIGTYNSRKSSADLQASISAKIVPNEIFADGDVDNSGFDLIHDLNNIEIILFQKNDLVSFGGSLADSGGGGGAPVPDASGQATDPLTGVPIPIDLTGTTGQPNQPPPAKPKVENPFKATIEDKSAIFTGGGINPNQCFPMTNLDQALDKFAEAASTNPGLKSSFVKPATQSTKSGTGSGAAGGGGVTGSDLNIPVPIVDSVPASTIPVVPAPAGDYTTPPICDEILCVSIDFVEAPATPAYTSTDNCIQCHVQYINESMQKTIAHSLIPAKATGNLGESGLCKNAAGTALGAIGMNINLSLVPIITPPKDDLTQLGNISDEWNKYAEKNGFWNYSEKQTRKKQAEATGKPVDNSPVMSETERMLEVELLNAPDGASQSDIMAATSAAYLAVQAAQTQEMLTLEISKDAYGAVDTLKALDDEMKAMNNYFDGFRKQFLTLLEDVPGLISSKACVKLNGKKECT